MLHGWFVKKSGAPTNSCTAAAAAAAECSSSSNRGKSVESFEVWQMSDTRPMFRHLGRSLREFVCRELGFRSFCIVTV